MQKDVPNDQELILKKRARRRLVGAIALVLLMIILLPMVLEDRTTTEPAEEITITLTNQNPKLEVLPAQSDFDSNVIPTESVALNNEVLKDSSSPVQQVEPDPKVALIKPTIEPQTAVKKKANAPQYYVQIGVFSDEANVKQLQAKLTDLGYASQTEKINTAKGEKIRLRTRLLGDRSEAAIALQNIKDAGLTGMVVSQ